MADSDDHTSLGLQQLLQQALPQHVLAGYMRYRKIRSLGRGGKAEVFLCSDVTLGRDVAVKVLHSTHLDSPWEQHMLVREARIMAALTHKGIPKIHDLGRDFEGRPYYAMSYIEGRTLRDILGDNAHEHSRAEQQYRLHACLGVLIEVAEILSLAHGTGVVHCDLKPENILINSQGSVYLIDWGLATVRTDEEIAVLEADFAAKRGRQGSPLYMSPEQAEHVSPAREASDIYSLGVLLYECLAGTTPHHGVDAEEVLANILNTEPVAPRRQSPDRYMPSEMERLCLNALAKQPADRPAHMTELAVRLRDCQLDLLVDYERDWSNNCPAANFNCPPAPALAYV